MKSLIIVTCLLAATTVVRGDRVEDLIQKYMNYLREYLTPCANAQGFNAEDFGNVQAVPKDATPDQMACLRSCVMKGMNALVDNKVNLEPILKMVDVVHEAYPEDIPKVKQIATDCAADVSSLTDECQIGMKYADCYIEKLMNT